MNITDNLKSVLIIDDNYDEIKSLESILDDEGIYHTYYTPDDIRGIQKQLKNHQIIFMDFSLDDTKKEAENISLIRKILKTICHFNFGSYGLVLWTKHIENINLLKEKLSQDTKTNRYISPLFIIGLDKLPYIKDGYNELWSDLNSELLKNKAATFFFNWRNSVESGADAALNKIYQLVPNYKEQNSHFLYMLYQIAKNHSGIPGNELEVYEGMYKDAYRAFDELLYTDLITKQCSFENIFNEQLEKPNWMFEQELELISQINAKLLLESSINDQQTIIPGNIYQVIKNNPLLRLKETPKKHNPIPIAIELTPPCDFAHKKISSRLIGGFIIDCPNDKENLYRYISKTFKADSKYLVWPICYDGKNRFICFDFRYIYVAKDEELKDKNNFQLLFMVKHRLFSDILQKFSSHAARLGLSIVHPNLDA